MKLITFLCGVFAIVVVDVVNAEMCKWVDKDGCVHYAETCPEGIDGIEIEIQAPPSQEQVAEADRQSARLEEIQKNRETQQSKSEMRTHKGRSLPLEELGPLPDNNTSTYLTTKGAYLNFGFEKGDMGQFHLVLKARDNLPRGAYLEAHFPNPANANQKQIVDKTLRHEGGDILMISPKCSGFKCWNYEVDVFVYKDDSKEELLDVHRQIIQSRADQSLFTGIEEWAEGMVAGGICPSAHMRDMKKMTVEQLEALCEREREKRLKPERDKLIERCIKRGEKQAEWCENYYADWGDAQRLDISTMRPALYYNLPECVAASKAREKIR